MTKSTRDENLMDLYHVSTTVPEHRDCRDVVFDWFRHGDQKPRPYRPNPNGARR